MKPNFNVVFIIIAALLLTLTLSCKKDPPKVIPTLSTVSAVNITTTSATSGGTITNDGKSPVTSRGVCWSTNQNPTATDSKTSDGSGIGSFTSTITGLTPGSTYYIRAYASNSIGTAYGNQVVATAASTQEQKNIIASVGGTLTTGESVQLVIPANALPADGVVFVGRTGNEPTSVPNPALTVVGSPITMKLPSYAILKPLQLSFPAPLGPIDTDAYSVFIYNGSTYYPFDYTINGGTVSVNIDVINWGATTVSTKTLLGDKILIFVKKKQILPQDLEMGLKEATIVSGKFTFSDPKTVNSSSKVLLMIHGWTGYPSSWEDFLKRVDSEPNHLSYTNYWTFGYNSSKSIESNAVILANLLISKSNNADIDVIAHSMGGLVARSMIEQHGGEQYINRLVTLGTPHKGAELAGYRDIIGAYVNLFVSTDEINSYNYNTAGFRDLYTGSLFIKELMKLTPPLSVPYYLIACKNNGTAYTSIIEIPGDDDGIVSVESAKGINGADTPDIVIKIDVPMAHMEMRRYLEIYEQVRDYLKRQAPFVSTTNATNITNTSVISGGNITNDGGTSITSRGVCWSTIQNPTTANSKTSNGIGIGSFTSTINGLTPGTTYYIRAYAVNRSGTGYGDQVTAITKTLAPNSIDIKSSPSGASVYLDGTNMNTITPATLIDVNAGYHNVRLFKFGYNEYSRDIYLPSGESFSINANLGNPLPPLPSFTITNPKNNSNLTHNVLTVSGNIVLRAANGTTTPFYGNRAILTINEVDQEVYVNNGSFSQEVLIKSGQNKLRLRANSPNGDTGTSDEIVFFGNFSTQDIQILLRWNNGISANPKDVDLHVYDSNNRHTYWLCTSKYSSHTNYYNAISNMIPESNLDFDNTIGYGPETFSLNKSTNTIYTVRVQFYAGHSSNNPTDANIQIILGGSILKTYGPYRFKNSFDNTYYDDPDCWWNVISFSYVNGVFTVINNIPVIPNNAINESNEKFHIK